MAIGRKRSRRNKNKTRTVEIAKYTVLVNHETSECDVCSLPSPVLYDFEDGSSLCELCSGNGGSDFLYRTAVIGGLYGGWAGGDW